jgi:hypothetical protein
MIAQEARGGIYFSASTPAKKGLRIFNDILGACLKPLPILT